ncbi:MAG: DUF4835 family protein [Bacteroidetes bacterium]|nr:DUF4835 family protein [Bacteroidota bacterium]
MSKDLNAGRKEILNALELMKKVFKQANNLYIMTAFFQAKADEIVLIFKEADPQDKNKAVEILNEISVQNQNKWATILQK